MFIVPTHENETSVVVSSYVSVVDRPNCDCKSSDGDKCSHLHSTFVTASPEDSPAREVAHFLTILAYCDVGAHGIKAVNSSSKASVGELASGNCKTSILKPTACDSISPVRVGHASCFAERDEGCPIRLTC